MLCFNKLTSIKTGKHVDPDGNWGLSKSPFDILQIHRSTDPPTCPEDTDSCSGMDGWLSLLALALDLGCVEL